MWIANYFSVSIIVLLLGCAEQPPRSMTVCEAGAQEKGFFLSNHFGTLIFFKQGTTEPIGDYQRYLRAFVFQACHEGATSIELQGNIDTSELDLSNGQLGRERAVKIRKLLVPLGLQLDEFHIVDSGPFRPLVPTRMGVAEPQNRRVALIAR